MATILTIDAGTTGVTALLVDEAGQLLARGYAEFPQHFPRPGWVEHDGAEITDALLDACRAALDEGGIDAADLTCIGITNQRETAIVWDRATGDPIHHAIVWQDRRTAGVCDRLVSHGHDAAIRSTTGLVVDAYFSGTKVAWLLDHVEGARTRAEAGELAFGTIDTWVVHQLTGGAAHVTEPSNACRTMLYDIGAREWSPAMCELLDVPMSLLAEVRPSTGEFGTTDPEVFFGASIPITGILGDQQAALFGQGCWTEGTSKNTYGTGSFVLLNTGSTRPTSARLLASIGWDLGDGPTYVLEGSIFVTGAAVQWLRDGLGVIESAEETGPLAESVGDTGDVYLVPAFTGLGAPHWDPYARGTIVGLTRGTTRAHLARAVVEAMAFQTRDVIEAMQDDSSVTLEELRADGGASAMDLLCQLQADLLGVPVLRPQVRETTALGAAFAAGLGAGVWSSTDDLADVWQLDARFEPSMDDDERHRRQLRWREAVHRSRGWAVDDDEGGVA
ncbi:glycerol kinase GlpK [Euzebya sp.]|uniref:glycerol kinase GlpK n=1 Tax=Euzebya sp. TaxID=1971409 RepID=UPI00351278A4